LYFHFWFAVARTDTNTFSDVRNPAQSQPRAWAFVHRDGGFPKRCTRPAGLRTSDGFAKGKTLRKAAVPLAARLAERTIKTERNQIKNFRLKFCLLTGTDGGQNSKK
jgi:hypothetical protein